MITRIRTPFYIFFLNAGYVAARSLRLLRSENTIILDEAEINCCFLLLLF